MLPLDETVAQKSSDEILSPKEAELRTKQALKLREVFNRYTRRSGPDYLLPQRRFEEFCMEAVAKLREVSDADVG